MLPVKFDFTVHEDRRGTNFEGVEAGHADPEGALNLHVRIARDHLVLSVWPVKGEIAQVTEQIRAKNLWLKRDKAKISTFLKKTR